MLSSTPSPELPPRDSHVEDGVLLYRLVPTRWCEVIEGEWVFQSGAFDNATPLAPGDSPDDMSVCLGDTLEALHRDPRDLPRDTPWTDDEEWGVAVLETAFVRDEIKQEVLRTPQEEEPAHGDVRGKKNSKRRKKLKEHARWLVPPAMPPLN